MTTYTVDTDGTSGTYSSLSAAHAALPNPLTDNYTIELAASTSVDDTTAIQITLNTTASYRLTIIQVDSLYRLRVSGAPAIDIRGGSGVVNNYTIQDVVMSRHTQTANYNQTFLLVNPRAGTIIVDGCTIKGEATTLRANVVELNHDSSTYPDVTTTLQNNLIICLSTSTNALSRVMEFDVVSPNVTLYNNTIVGNSTGTPIIYYAGSTTDDDNVNFTNNLIYLCADSNGSLNPGTADYNAFDGAFDFGGSNDRSSQTFTFEDASTEDYHLASTDAGAIGYGVGPSTDSDVPTLDHDGETRSGTTCDIGAFEYVSSGGTTFNVSVAESLTLTESAGGALIISASVAETMNMSATAGPTTDIPQTISESLVITDATTGAVIMPGSVAESLVLSEASSVNITMPASVAESLLLSDNVSTTAILNVSIADSFVLIDAAYSGGAILDLIINETINLSDVASLVNNINVSISESLVTTDGVILARSINTSVSESLVLTDGASTTVNLSITIDENLSLIDQIALIGTYNFTISEQLSLTDTASSGDLVDGQLRMCITGKSGTITVGGKSASISVTYKTGDITISGSNQDGC